MHVDSPVPHRITTAQFETANDRWKRGATARWSNAMVAAVALHFAVFAWWPQMSAAALTRAAEDLMLIAVPDYELPPPPEQIARPAAPILGSADVNPDITIPPNTFDALAGVRIEPPPPGTNAPQRDDYLHFAPTMVAPRVLNPQEVQHALLRNYPPMLREAGIGGKVEMLLWLDENGVVTRSQIGTSSGMAALDEAALKVLDVMKLSPALNAGRAVRVIVTIPIVFNVR